jgi:hypothetical protein
MNKRGTMNKRNEDGRREVVVDGVVMVFGQISLIL